MKYESLDGYSLCHLAKDRHSILREKRLVLGLTQQQLANKAKVSFSQYQKFESGERNIMTASFQNVCKVIRALDMDVNKFFDGDYVIGEPVKETPNGLVYARGGRPFNKEVE